MGNSQSPSIDHRFVSASRAFTPRELDELKSLFNSLASKSDVDGSFITRPVFMDYFELKGRLGDRAFDLITQERKDGKLTLEDLVIFKSVYEKGTSVEIDEIAYRLIDITGDGVAERSDLESVLQSIFEMIFSRGYEHSNSDMVKSILNAYELNFFERKSSSEYMSLEDFRSWSASAPSVRKAIGSLLSPPATGRPGFLVPNLKHEKNQEEILLKEEHAWHIGGAISVAELGKWTLLYNSAVNGLSFNTFFTSISSFTGPTVLVVRDREGFIYGGYASQTWERHADFYGDMKSFLFTLHPRAAIFRATGANKNVQWCAANFSSESIPNGMGFGGRPNHMGLFISASFDEVHTFACATFGSPSLSAANRVVPELIECWGVAAVAPAETQPESQSHGKGTVLERYKEDRRLLNMVGIANSSD